MDAVCIAALVFSVVSLCLALLFIVRQREYSLKIALRLSEHEDRLNNHSEGMARKYDFDKLRKTVDAHLHADDSEAKLVGLALAERLDALSARMDAVELACGVREKPKTMGGAK